VPGLADRGGWEVEFDLAHRYETTVRRDAFGPLRIWQWTLLVRLQEIALTM
jgi:hypothetical protein